MMRLATRLGPLGVAIFYEITLNHPFEPGLPMTRPHHALQRIPIRNRDSRLKVLPTLFDHETKDRFDNPQLRCRVGNTGRLFRHVGAISSLQSSGLLGCHQSTYIAPPVTPLIGFSARTRWLLACHRHYCARDHQWPAQARREVGFMGAPDIDRHL